MSAGIGLGLGGSPKRKDATRQETVQGTQFPANQVNQFEKVYGPGIRMPELLGGGLPTTTSLFGGQRVGIIGTQQPQPQVPGFTTPPGQIPNFPAPGPAPLNLPAPDQASAFRWVNQPGRDAFLQQLGQTQGPAAPPGPARQPGRDAFPQAPINQTQTPQQAAAFQQYQQAQANQLQQYANAANLANQGNVSDLSAGLQNKMWNASDFVPQPVNKAGYNKPGYNAADNPLQQPSIVNPQPTTDIPGFGGNQGAFPGTQAPQQPIPGTGADRKFNVSDITNAVKSNSGLLKNVDEKIVQEALNNMRNNGIDYTQGFTIDQFLDHAGSLPKDVKDYLRGSVFGELEATGELRDTTAEVTANPRFEATGSKAGIDANQGVANLGFGQKDQGIDAEANAQRIQTERVNAEKVAGAQSDIGKGDLDKYQQSLFQERFDPVKREIERQGKLDDRALNARLAQSGLASSGTGVGQLAMQGQERSRQIAAAATDAANQAATQRFGQQFTQELENTKLRQQANLTSAGFDLEAQKANAVNILQKGTAQSDAYLKAIGLNNEQVTQARDSFLRLLGIQEADLARQDQFQMDSLGVLFGNWIQTFAQVMDAGRFSVSESKGTQTSGGFQGSLGVGVGTAGAGGAGAGGAGK